MNRLTTHVPTDAPLMRRRIVVTGGTSGIGESAALAFVAAGADVVVMGTSPERGARVEAKARSARGATARFIRCDVRDRRSVEAAFARATDTLGGLDVLVNAAGVREFAPAEELSDEHWALMLDTNLTGVFLTNQAAFPALREAGGGRILNFSSNAALGPFARGAAYSAAKAGVVAWTRTIAHEWGRHGITANALVPAMWTPMYEERRNGMSVAEREAHDAVMLRQIPVGGRLGDPDRDMAPVLLFLAGEGARFITGQIINVDGGFSWTR
jgi:NAD(P)-dependent dehydrogenase (short-subunit alcohol dehydrogenase family)